MHLACCDKMVKMLSWTPTPTSSITIVFLNRAVHPQVHTRAIVHLPNTYRVRRRFSVRLDCVRLIVKSISYLMRLMHFDMFHSTTTPFKTGISVVLTWPSSHVHSEHVWWLMTQPSYSRSCLIVKIFDHTHSGCRLSTKVTPPRCEVYRWVRMGSTWPPPVMITWCESLK